MNTIPYSLSSVAQGVPGGPLALPYSLEAEECNVSGDGGVPSELDCFQPLSCDSFDSHLNFHHAGELTASYPLLLSEGSMYTWENPGLTLASSPSNFAPRNLPAGPAIPPFSPTSASLVMEIDAGNPVFVSRNVPHASFRGNWSQPTHTSSDGSDSMTQQTRFTQTFPAAASPSPNISASSSLFIPDWEPEFHLRDDPDAEPLPQRPQSPYIAPRLSRPIPQREWTHEQSKGISGRNQIPKLRKQPFWTQQKDIEFFRIEPNIPGMAGARKVLGVPFRLPFRYWVDPGKQMFQKDSPQGITIRIEWPGYETYRKRVTINVRGKIVNRYSLAHLIEDTYWQFFHENENVRCESEWRVSGSRERPGITTERLVLVRLRNVSRGSWMADLELEDD